MSMSDWKLEQKARREQWERDTEGLPRVDRADLGWDKCPRDLSVKVEPVVLNDTHMEMGWKVTHDHHEWFFEDQVSAMYAAQIIYHQNVLDVLGKRFQFAPPPPQSRSGSKRQDNFWWGVAAGVAFG